MSLRTPSTRSAKRKINPLDALQRGNRMVLLYGPIRVPSREAFVDALIRLAAVPGAWRLATRVENDGKTWAVDEWSFASRAETMIEVSTERGEQLLRRVFHQSGSWVGGAAPMRFSLSPEYIAASFDRSIADGAVLARIVPAILAVANGGPVPQWVTAADEEDPVGRAVKNAFGRRPGGFTAAKRDRAAAEARIAKAEPLGESSQVPWDRRSVCVEVPLTSRQAAAIRAGSSKDGGSRSIGAALLFRLWRTLQEEEIAVAPFGEVILDARRYLPAGVEAKGNFSTALRVSLHDARSVQDIDDQVQAALESGGALHELTAFAKHLPKVRDEVRPPSRANQVEATLSIDVLPPLDELEALPWAPDGEPRLSVISHPSTPEAIEVHVTTVAGRFQLTLTFDDSVFDAERVAAAVSRVGTTRKERQEEAAALAS